ncbi:OLC1v1024146C1 [Oldenlandia corymbosa var. corymbosa]|uniref:OLC1v1024146C1 n=1 Tax=Oldenlandia corymbosa var. corymbosa TaxID=529605 RepID=A0AAV1C256_OLDCO|nr:OLC1v1024146C1 [Oldenlandia corymbosa var. corymbosa]
MESHLRISSRRDDCAHHRALFRCLVSSGDVNVFKYDTRKFKKLADFDTKSKNQWFKRQGLFEYNEVDDDYQVYVVASGHSGENWTDLYSWRTNSWRRIEGFVCDWTQAFVVAHGRLYRASRTSRGP